ncbi:MAG: ergothioneine biosynthesis protein EgtB [Cyanophyceae cyanobacterium]
MATHLSLDQINIQLPLQERYQQVRQLSQDLCQPLKIEDYGIQSMADVSPPKWHLAHTTWFFETFLLQPNLRNYHLFHPRYGYLFNSYYETVGARHPRPERGLLSRPTVAEVYDYRAYIDQAMRVLLKEHLGDPAIQGLVELGLHHEHQHQELLLTDIKHILATNPLRPSYSSDLPQASPAAAPSQEQWLDYPGGMVTLGADDQGFAFDNERPRHPVYLQDYWLASRLVTQADYLDFIEAGGYRQAEWWLAEGWATIQNQGWQAPLYWEHQEGQWWVMTLAGLRPLAPQDPVCHVSYFEADAFARWKGRRLPTEAEWEAASTPLPLEGNFLSQGYLHPIAAQGITRPDQFFGDVWEWTQSPYTPYPGFKTAAGAVGEYNGKFMCNQMVLRGGSCATPHSHLRPTYRNFFPPATRWQFSGIRLAM